MQLGMPTLCSPPAGGKQGIHSIGSSVSINCSPLPCPAHLREGSDASLLREALVQVCGTAVKLLLQLQRGARAGGRAGCRGLGFRSWGHLRLLTGQQSQERTG
jgi:hypothetical protein